MHNLHHLSGGHPLALLPHRCNSQNQHTISIYAAIQKDLKMDRPDRAISCDGNYDHGNVKTAYDL